MTVFGSVRPLRRRILYYKVVIDGVGTLIVETFRNRFQNNNNDKNKKINKDFV